MNGFIETAGAFINRQLLGAGAAIAPYMADGAAAAAPIIEQVQQAAQPYIETAAPYVEAAVDAMPADSLNLVATVSAAAVGAAIGTMVMAPRQVPRVANAAESMADAPEEEDDEEDDGDEEDEVQITIKRSRATKKSNKGGLLVAVTGASGAFKGKTVNPSKIEKGKQLRGCVHHVGGMTRGARLTDKRLTTILKTHQEAHDKGALKNGKCTHHVTNWKKFASQYGGVGGVCPPVQGVAVE